MSFRVFNFDSPINTALKKCGFQVPISIQNKAIGHLLEDSNLMGVSQTGTGKTTAFVLPVIQHLLQRSSKSHKPFDIDKPSKTRLLLQFSAFGDGKIVRQIEKVPERKIPRQEITLLGGSQVNIEAGRPKNHQQCPASHKKKRGYGKKRAGCRSVGVPVFGLKSCFDN